MRYSDLHLNLINNKFKHNLNSDFGYFALWKDAIQFKSEIKDFLADKFEILLEAEVEWSEEFFYENACRIYEHPLNKSGRDRNNRIIEKIGNRKFYIFVVKDASPNYSYAISVSKNVELSNLNIVEAKAIFREWIFGKTKERYGVHSTNSIFEFFFQAPLILGVNLFCRILNEEKINHLSIKKDLEGAGGWKNYYELFNILNLTNNYLVQRGFEELPENNPEMDIDFLTDNYQRLASTIGLVQDIKRPYKGYIYINNEKISIDIRFVGDNYYNNVWEKNMLQRKIFKNNVFTPRDDDYFFTLLYHAKVHKKKVKEKYIGILSKLAEELNFKWYNMNLIENDKLIGQILNGYYSGNGYFFERPIDSGVFNNNAVTANFYRNKERIGAQDSLITKGKKRIKRMIPMKIKKLIKNVIR